MISQQFVSECLGRWLWMHFKYSLCFHKNESQHHFLSSFKMRYTTDWDKQLYILTTEFKCYYIPATDSILEVLPYKRYFHTEKNHISTVMSFC